MSRQSGNQFDPTTGQLINGFDYYNQAWVVNKKYIRCGHPDSMECGCYGRINEGKISLGVNPRINENAPAPKRVRRSPNIKTIQVRTSTSWAGNLQDITDCTCSLCNAKLWTGPGDTVYCDEIHGQDLLSKRINN